MGNTVYAASTVKQEITFVGKHEGKKRHLGNIHKRLSYWGAMVHPEFEDEARFALL